MKMEQLTPFLILPNNTAAEAMQKIDRNAKGILFVVDRDRKLVGALTDGDIRRWLIKTGDLQGIIEKFMTVNPLVIYRKDVNGAVEFMNTNSISALPVITIKGEIVDIIFRNTERVSLKRKNTNHLRHVPTIIMAGGRGTRLYPYTDVLPKPLIPIGGIPITERIINEFYSFGIRNFYITVNYKRNMIKAYFSDVEHGFTLKYVEEEQPLGTAGSLRLLLSEKFSKPIIVSNCDILIQADYVDIYNYHLKMNNSLTMICALKNIVVPYGVVQSSENGQVLSIEEKPKQSYFINTGMYILNPEILEKIPDGTFFHMTDLADKLLKEGYKVGMYPISEDSFLDMGEVEEMQRMEEKLDSRIE